MRLFIRLSYNGSAYSGWQRQNNAPSVQAELERAFSVYFRNKTEITGAGRTDAGVHAINYVAHFDINDADKSKEPQKLLYKINAILPGDITVNNICQVDGNSHARFDAVSRTYKYFIHTRKDPFLTHYSFLYPYSLDIDAMNRAVCHIIGEHDFTSMAKLHSDTNNNICNVTGAGWLAASPISILNTADNDIDRFATNNDKSGYTFCFTITANRFLRNMVRAVVGSLLEIGRGVHDPEHIIEILKKRDRGAAGNSVPPHPLFLTGIEYPYRLFD
jgi:pseudouridylate synthase I